MDCEVALLHGSVVDPERGEIYGADIGISGGRVVAIDRGRGGLNSQRVIDVRGAYVVPTLVDCHVHCYEHVNPGSLSPDRIGVKQGVGAILDAGSFGPGNADGFQQYIVNRASTRVFGLVNVSRWGKSSNPGEGEIVGFLSPTDVVRTIDRSGGWVKGVKVRAAAKAVGALGILPVRLAKEAAREAGVPVMVHLGLAPPTLEEVCGVLTAGDVLTHCFNGRLGGSITRKGDLLPAVADALSRGVLLDVGHGSNGFAWWAGERAASLGLFPHSISTDLNRGCVEGPVYSLVTTMAKFLHLGMSLVDVVRATTLAPARAFGLEPEFGRIAEGGPANLSVIAVVDRSVDLFDSFREARRVDRTIEARYAIVNGTVYEAGLT